MMTLDEWTDEIARMTPRQKEAMAAAMEAAYFTAVGDDDENWKAEIRTLLGPVLRAGPLVGYRLLNAVYPNAIPERG